jgi:hypothetical protein
VSRCAACLPGASAGMYVGERPSVRVSGAVTGVRSPGFWCVVSWKFGPGMSYVPPVLLWFGQYPAGRQCHPICVRWRECVGSRVKRQGKRCCNSELATRTDAVGSAAVSPPSGAGGDGRKVRGANECLSGRTKARPVERAGRVCQTHRENTLSPAT